MEPIRNRTRAQVSRLAGQRSEGLSIQTPTREDTMYRMRAFDVIGIGFALILLVALITVGIEKYQCDQDMGFLKIIDGRIICILEIDFEGM